MSEAYLMSDMFKNLPSSTSPVLGTWVICSDSSGNISKLKARDLSSLQMQVTGMDYVTDFNEALTAGVFMLDGSSEILNAPPGMSMMVGMLEVFYRGGTSGLVYQRATSRLGQTAVRTRWYGVWQEWHVMQ